MLSTTNLLLVALIVAILVLVLYRCGRTKTERLGCDTNMYTASMLNRSDTEAKLNKRM